MDFPKMHNYPAGARIQRRSGYIFTKTAEGMKAESRWVAEQKILSRDLEPGERVFHKNGDREDNSAQNLSVIKFNTTKYVPLKTSRVLFVPKHALQNYVKIKQKKDLAIA